jgi:hypothetical protein
MEFEQKEFARLQRMEICRRGPPKFTSAKSGRVRSISNQSSSVTATTRLTPISDAFHSPRMTAVRCVLVLSGLSNR